MSVFLIVLGFILGNEYREQDGAVTYVHSKTVVHNDRLVTDRIITVRQGVKPLTYELLWVEQDKIVLELHN